MSTPPLLPPSDPPVTQAVEAAIHSTPGLQGRDQRLKEWKAKAYTLSNADARALSARLLNGKQVQWQDWTLSSVRFY